MTKKRAGWIVFDKRTNLPWRTKCFATKGAAMVTLMDWLEQFGGKRLLREYKIEPVYFGRYLGRPGSAKYWAEQAEELFTDDLQVV